MTTEGFLSQSSALVQRLSTTRVVFPLPLYNDTAGFVLGRIRDHNIGYSLQRTHDFTAPLDLRLPLAESLSSLPRPGAVLDILRSGLPRLQTAHVIALAKLPDVFKDACDKATSPLIVSIKTACDALAGAQQGLLPGAAVSAPAGVSMDAVAGLVAPASKPSPPLVITLWLTPGDREALINELVIEPLYQRPKLPPDVQRIMLQGSSLYLQHKIMLGEGGLKAARFVVGGVIQSLEEPMRVRPKKVPDGALDPRVWLLAAFVDFNRRMVAESVPSTSFSGTLLTAFQKLINGQSMAAVYIPELSRNCNFEAYLGRLRMHAANLASPHDPELSAILAFLYGGDKPTPADQLTAPFTPLPATTVTAVRRRTLTHGALCNMLGVHRHQAALSLVSTDSRYTGLELEDARAFDVLQLLGSVYGPTSILRGRKCPDPLQVLVVDTSTLQSGHPGQATDRPVTLVVPVEAAVTQTLPVASCLRALADKQAATAYRMGGNRFTVFAQAPFLEPLLLSAHDTDVHAGVRVLCQWANIPCPAISAETLVRLRNVLHWLANTAPALTTDNLKAAWHRANTEHHDAEAAASRDPRNYRPFLAATLQNPPLNPDSFRRCLLAVIHKQTQSPGERDVYDLDGDTKVSKPIVTVFGVIADWLLVTGAEQKWTWVEQGAIMAVSVAIGQVAIREALEGKDGIRLDRDCDGLLSILDHVASRLDDRASAVVRRAGLSSDIPGAYAKKSLTDQLRFSGQSFSDCPAQHPPLFGSSLLSQVLRATESVRFGYSSQSEAILSSTVREVFGSRHVCAHTIQLPIGKVCGENMARAIFPGDEVLLPRHERGPTDKIPLEMRALLQSLDLDKWNVTLDKTRHQHQQSVERLDTTEDLENSVSALGSHGHNAYLPEHKRATLPPILASSSSSSSSSSASWNSSAPDDDGDDNLPGYEPGPVPSGSPAPDDDDDSWRRSPSWSATSPSNQQEPDNDPPWDPAAEIAVETDEDKDVVIPESPLQSQDEAKAVATYVEQQVQDEAELLDATLAGLATSLQQQGSKRPASAPPQQRKAKKARVAEAVVDLTMDEDAQETSFQLARCFKHVTGKFRPKLLPLEQTITNLLPCLIPERRKPVPVVATKPAAAAVPQAPLPPPATVIGAKKRLSDEQLQRDRDARNLQHKAQEKARREREEADKKAAKAASELKAQADKKAAFAAAELKAQQAKARRELQEADKKAAFAAAALKAQQAKAARVIVVPDEDEDLNLPDETEEQASDDRVVPEYPTDGPTSNVLDLVDYD